MMTDLGTTTASSEAAAGPRLRMRVVTAVAVVATLSAGCGELSAHLTGTQGEVAEVQAVAETDPVRGEDDAADDPAIWVHPDDAARSTIIGTDKKSGLAVYDLSGAELHFYGDGKHNNVDVAYGFRVGRGTVDVAVTSDLDNHAVRLRHPEHRRSDEDGGMRGG
jgi:myo-inositol-hexaphosphate 3-phosphohydrolase